ncbi:hypothetical protein PTSG_05231 [Salpingoeca rosetta]|uniref:Dual specificity protein phosphatase n=1 Tax=Salpingoeca rosetta (strain ATCC 50818 / BSB-021) TaxID=946362 RepID=F2UAW1_SALR5|nr:uncharacterized protein PTSG_05231 [Salpingoeca rosetta]EGD73527.1 hypothetical protein PTSG_05231 [Salpingoeca rosetta]|eukprot:XP_004993809.1 hypothetical protein PTSG_05231 [Salpingoeca rosetta]
MDEDQPRDVLAGWCPKPPCKVNVSGIQTFFTALQAVRAKHGDVPEEHEQAFTRFRMAVTNDTTDEEVETARAALQHALERLDLPHISTDVQPTPDIARPSNLDDFSGFTEMQLVVPGLYIGSFHPASNKDVLEAQGITHVCCCVGVDPYFPDDFFYKVLPADDSPEQDMYQYFEDTYKFIHDAVSSDGRVLVHCGAGISRAATITLAYLLRSLRMPLNEAFSHLHHVRPVISPNTGFVRQLRRLEAELGLKDSPQ